MTYYLDLTYSPLDLTDVPLDLTYLSLGFDRSFPGTRFDLRITGSDRGETTPRFDLLISEFDLVSPELGFVGIGVTFHAI